MHRIIPQELVGFKKLNYDIYDDKGNIVYKKGAMLTPNALLSLTQMKIYRMDSEFSFDFDEKNLIKHSLNQEFKSVISEKATESLLKSTRQILKATAEGVTPDISVCSEARDTIIEEVGNKLDKIECIGQLRIFDEYTFSHTLNVSTICSAIGLTLKLSENDIRDLTMGGLLDYIGKLKIPLEILNKPGALTHDEFQLMKNHTVLGYNFLIENMNLPESIAKVALEHQEKYAGLGYPSGIKGDDISQFAQIASVADVYDALVSKRVYKKAMLSHDAIRIMVEEGGKTFNPSILYKFIYLANYRNPINIVTNNE